MQSFARVTSGLFAAQTGLYTTGHNISNAKTEGYTRQRANFADESYLSAGYNQSGNLKVGLGAKLLSTSQIRDEFLDKTYRKATSKASFHGIKEAVVTEMEGILGELYGDARLSDSINKLWSSMQELMTHPDGIEARSMFVQSAISFVTKADEIGQGLYDFQVNLNQQVIESVNRINQITTQIEDLNKKIVLNESCGDNANDLRDVRNLLVDELAGFGDLDIKEDYSGRLTILMEGKDLVSNGSAKLLGLRYTSNQYPFVEPVFGDDYTKNGKILTADETARKLFTDLDTGLIGGLYDNDNGSLKALMLTRGKTPANYTTDPKAVENYTIPKFQREIDILINKVVTLVNDALAPKDHDSATAPTDLKGGQFTELFSRKLTERYDAGGVFIDEDPTKPSSLYSMGNIEINKDVLNNFNKLCLSQTGDVGDTSVVEKMLDEWKGVKGGYLPQFNNSSTPLSFDAYYKELVTNLGEEGSASKVYVNAQTTIVRDAIAARQSLSGVAIDEEMTEMMKFQHAYDAAAKMVNVIDSMIDQIVNRLKA